MIIIDYKKKKQDSQMLLPTRSEPLTRTFYYEGRRKGNSFRNTHTHTLFHLHVIIIHPITLFIICITHHHLFFPFGTTAYLWVKLGYCLRTIKILYRCYLYRKHKNTDICLNRVRVWYLVFD
ncbi:hypothetical protein BDA99DRAFT_58557 [Phascolomyces articulosus]|uniref:Uncharacterized protein n=1 Tax=Phascolomyces articulosus TaxID=60185 RepID=A0AAD5K016_9FUNG|nr:hypothetical protein BDA99DRAFT_58557 [Phascolomyces articulosus]